jgi:RNA polymerase sigma-70 factor (ECF subfamily)
MGDANELIPDLFRTEYRKIVSVLCSYFGLLHIETAEDIASDTFLLAAELWPYNGIPANPQGWLYVVAKNKTKDYIKRTQLFEDNIKPFIINNANNVTNQEPEFSETTIKDSQLQMLFAICHPSIPESYQVSLALRILCGFGIEEIANAFLSNKETINKRLLRAKEKLRMLKIYAELPNDEEIKARLDSVLKVLYLLFNEGYYSQSSNYPIRKELCAEAIRLSVMLKENNQTNRPEVNALLSLMCFNASRLDARLSPDGNIVLFNDQDRNLWDYALVEKGNHYLINSAVGNVITKYHIEAYIAFWHTQPDDFDKKWQHIYNLYGSLLEIEYSSNIVLSRLYAFSKLKGTEQAIQEIEKLNLENDVTFHSLLGDLYKPTHRKKANEHYDKALELTKQAAIRSLILKKSES